MNEKKTFVVILNYNSSADVEKCLIYLKRQTYTNLSIIVVDNASPSDDERHSVEKICVTYKVGFIQSDVNNGFSAGNNLGLEEAVKNGAVWCLVINPDVELRNSEYIRTVLVKVLEYPQAVVIGTDVRMPDGTRQNPMRECTYREDLLWPLDLVRRKTGLWKGYLAADCTGYCEKVSGCCFFIKATFLIENGFLDDTVFMYCEEPILARQVRYRGYRELYIKELTANHQHFSSHKHANSKRMIMLTMSRSYYLSNYSGYSGIMLKAVLISKKIQKWVWQLRGNP